MPRRTRRRREAGSKLSYWTIAKRAACDETGWWGRRWFSACCRFSAFVPDCYDTPRWRGLTGCRRTPGGEKSAEKCRRPKIPPCRPIHWSFAPTRRQEIRGHWMQKAANSALTFHLRGVGQSPTSIGWLGGIAKVDERNALCILASCVFI